MNNRITEWVLRIAIAGMLAGHGVFALQGKQAWIDWFATFGISDAGTAARLLLLIGAMDVAIAALVLVRPVRVALLWVTVWAFWTALVRPLVGEPIWDFVERSANWGAPLALLLIRGWPGSWREWLK